MAKWKCIKELSCLSESDLMPRQTTKGEKDRANGIQTNLNELQSEIMTEKVPNIKRSSVARNSMNNILKKIPRGRREKIKAEEDQNLQNTGITANNSKNYKPSLRVPKLNSTELRSMRNYPSYLMGRSTMMTSKLWNLTRVTVREKTDNKNEVDKEILEKELTNLCKISHPNILLLMGVCPANDDQPLQLVFEHVHLGSMYAWMHQKGKVPSLKHCSDIIIQITDALIFLHNLHFLHCAITSHAIQLVSTSVAKLGQFEFVIDSRQTQTQGLAEHSQSLLDCAGWQCFYNWLSPEVLRGEAVSKQSDVYSLCCVVYELSTGTIPWAQMSADRIKESIRKEGVALPLDQETMPLDLYQVLSKGLQANSELRDLDLHEIRDVFHKIKEKIEKEAEVKEKPMKQKTLPSKPCPSRSLSSSAIQYNHQRYLRKLSNDPSQRSCSQTSSDYSFVSNQAKRNFLRSQPSSPSRQIGLGRRSRTSIFYDAFSLSSGLDFSGSDSSRDQPGDTSDSSSSSLSPTSGYSSYDLLDQVQPAKQESDHDIRKRRSVLFLSVRNSHQHDKNNTRSRSVPRISGFTDSQDYTTGIKPASHRLENHSSSCCVQSANATPKHSTLRYKTREGEKRKKRSLNCNQKESNNNHGEFPQQQVLTREVSIPRMKALISEENTKFRQLAHASLCKSHPRLFSKLSSESGYGSSSPIGLAENLKGVNQCNSSTEHMFFPGLISRLSRKLSPNTNSVNKAPGLKAESQKKDAVQAKHDCQKVCEDLKSAHQVKNLSSKERKLSRSEFAKTDVQPVVRQMARITHQQPLRARIKSVNGSDDQITASEHANMKSSKKLDSNKSLRSTAGSKNTEGGKSVEKVQNQTFPENKRVMHQEMHCCNNKQLRMMSSISSSTMASLPSLAYSLRDTEDLYCDDELHPSLENDPNMRLYTENINAEQQTRDCIDGQRIFDIGDDESILSMEIPSTGPQSLLSCSNVDTASFISECEDRGGRGDMGDARYSTVIVWGVDQNTDISSEDESTP
eukprot:TRINITY_DN2079_c0_g2_i5.p1 TRINITY_DN2079_c0_g2~~TRINITY_DN2079_c0_g2_i5.p1  ORF type:complete len:1033 (+),score=228.16 TRINITY_DN2079_c0_g2_i5:42-3101(+)